MPGPLPLPVHVQTGTNNMLPGPAWPQHSLDMGWDDYKVHPEQAVEPGSSAAPPLHSKLQQE